MMAFFVLSERKTEALVITVILVVSIIYAAISHEEVFDLSKLEDEN